MTTLGSVALFLIGALSSGCSSAPRKELFLFADGAPCPVIVAKGTELVAASNAAKNEHGAFAVRGEGSSMEPFYPSGTAIVVRVCGFERLHRGMAIVYRNSQGAAVAHMLLDKTPLGWTAIGLNNEKVDDEIITEANFIGLVTQAYSSQTMRLPTQVAQRIAFNQQIKEAVGSAYAHAD